MPAPAPLPAGPAVPRPTRADLLAARDTTIPDVIAPGLRVLFAGINPGLYSAATGHHFARPGNRFWPALHRSGFTPRLFRPDEQGQLLGLGLGITNVAARATARAAELSPAELRAGADLLYGKLSQFTPRWLAVLGVTAYRTAFGVPGAVVGPQPAVLGPTQVWILPNPSGLNAHYSTKALAAEFARLREAAGLRARPPSARLVGDGGHGPPFTHAGSAMTVRPDYGPEYGEEERREERLAEFSEEGMLPVERDEAVERELEEQEQEERDNLYLDDADSNELHAPGQRCARCGQVIQPGDDVRMRADGKWQHEVCPPTTGSAPAAAQ